jgi:hypothetical protein
MVSFVTAIMELEHIIYWSGFSNGNIWEYKEDIILKCTLNMYCVKT